MRMRACSSLFKSHILVSFDILDSHGYCGIGKNRCKDGTCIYDYEICDGHFDCSANEDELNCSKYFFSYLKFKLAPPVLLASA